MKNILIIAALFISINCFSQNKNVNGDTLKIDLTDFQKEQIAGIEKKKQDIIDALEKQKKDLFLQLDSQAELILSLILDYNKVKKEEIDYFAYKNGKFYITKKKK